MREMENDRVTIDHNVYQREKQSTVTYMPKTWYPHVSEAGLDVELDAILTTTTHTHNNL